MPLRPDSAVVRAHVAAAPLGAQASLHRHRRQHRCDARGTGQPWQIVPQPQSSLVYARDGSLIGEIGRESRTSVPIRTLPKYVGQAFVAVEDQRFYQHDGVDLIGVAGAIKGKLLEGSRATTAAARARSRSSSSATCTPTRSTVGS